MTLVMSLIAVVNSENMVFTCLSTFLFYVAFFAN